MRNALESAATGEAEATQGRDLLPQVHVQRRLAVGHEREVVGRLPPFPDLADPLLDLSHDLPGGKEGAPLRDELGGAPDLAVDARVAARLGPDVVDAEAPPQAAGRDGAEAERVAPGRLALLARHRSLSCPGRRVNPRRKRERARRGPRSGSR